jgi:hypothetical protein
LTPCRPGRIIRVPPVLIAGRRIGETSGMGKILAVLAVFACLVACGDVRYGDSEMSNIEVPRDHEGDVDEPIE